MKKTRLLNSELSYIIAKLGHTQSIVIADCGLPIPEDVKRIDLALVRGLPSFEAVLDAVLSEMEVEEYVVAEELGRENLAIAKHIEETMGNIPKIAVSHEEFKKLVNFAQCVIRTGEATPYANIILQSGVKF